MSQSTFTTTVWNLKGGAPDLQACTDTVQLDVGSLVTNTVTGAQVLLRDITLNLATDSIDYTVATANGDVTIKGLMLSGVQGGFVFGDYATYSASEVFMNRTAAAALDSLLVAPTRSWTRTFSAPSRPPSSFPGPTGPSGLSAVADW